MRSYLLVFALLINLPLFAMDKKTEQAFFITEEGDRKVIKFGTKEALEKYLQKCSRTEEWEKIKPEPGANLNVILNKNPCFMLQAQTTYALVKENAPEFWEALLASLPNKSFSMQELADNINSMGEKIYEKKIAEEQDNSVHFMIIMQGFEVAGNFIKLFLEQVKI